jgi:DNA polymerase
MFVGLAPGRFGGDRTGIPFSGDRSGKLLREMIQRSGLRSVFITNVIRCNPKDRRGRNRNPTRREIANCRRYLEAEIGLVKPRLIACLGQVAWRELAGKTAKFRPMSGALLHKENVRLVAMYHPAYINRGNYSECQYLEDFAHLRQLADA